MQPLYGYPLCPLHSAREISQAKNPSRTLRWLRWVRCLFSLVHINLIDGKIGTYLVLSYPSAGVKITPTALAATSGGIYLLTFFNLRLIAVNMSVLYIIVSPICLQEYI